MSLVGASKSDKMKVLSTFLIICCLLGISKSQFNPNYVDNRTVMVQLFDWTFNDIADECVNFLGPYGFGGVQVSPITECWISEQGFWYERYSVISYKIFTRSGTEEEFARMVKVCQEQGVRIYVNVVFNHMTANLGPEIYGYGGSVAYPPDYYYPAVPYNKSHFHPECDITNFQNASEVRNCQLYTLRDLNQTIPYVREKIIGLLDHLIDLGVAGFRIDAAKHMDPSDLGYIYSHTKNLNPLFGFKHTDTALFAQEVIDYGFEPITASEYSPIGVVTEFKACYFLGVAFRGKLKLAVLKTWGPSFSQLSMLPSNRAFVFVDNHDTERQGGPDLISYKDGKIYIMAVIFNLAHIYGTPRIMSSYAFDNYDQGPPHDENNNIIGPGPFTNGETTCTNDWICQHRWRPIRNMVQFRNVVKEEPLTLWYDNGGNQIAFSRGGRGFVAFNNEDFAFSSIVKTSLPTGIYCDVISGEKINGICTGKIIAVMGGEVTVNIPANDEFGTIAIHTNSKL
uniref:Alpha-amylase n=1 Tax=Sergentomyia schwetzi TaxID=114605 RepID=A0A6B9VME7_9DIPT|nr:salivary amylase [Sergentomyia schwetzi]